MTATATNRLQRLLASFLLMIVACAPSVGQAAAPPRETGQDNTIRLYKKVALPKKHRTAALLGDSDHLEVGQKVLAIGHPFGLGYALTTGIISGLGAGQESAAPLHAPMIQTRAPINPGNSGGPLVDQEGRVIGINTTILAGAQNIGFAIPIGLVKGVVGELQTRGRVGRPWLGITGKLLSDEVIDLFALPLAKGILIAGVAKGSPAERAGLRAGDLPSSSGGRPSYWEATFCWPSTGRTCARRNRMRPSSKA